MEYGSPISDMEEEAFVVGGDSKDDDEGHIAIGTGTYLVRVKLTCQIPNILPIQGKYISINYSGINIQCKDCYGYHKKTYSSNQNQF